MQPYIWQKCVGSDVDIHTVDPLNFLRCCTFRIICAVTFGIPVHLYMLCIDAAMHCSLDTTQLKHLLHMCILKNIFCLDICVVTTQCLHVLELNYLVQQQVL